MMADELGNQQKLASAGDDIKIWNISSYQIAHQFTTHLATSFRNVHWSFDLQQLVSVPAAGSFLLLTLVKQQSVQHLEVDTKIPNTTAKFSSTSSRYLGVGSKCGDIVIWDIKHSKPKKALKSSYGEVSCLQFNWNDSYIASGFIDGNIVLHNTTTGQSTLPLFTPNSQAIRDLHYSYVKKSLFGCTSDDGTVALWDANTRQPYHRFTSAHSAPATSLAFSPVNFLLLTSVGLDKKIICYDSNVKRFVKSFNCESPLTSVDLKEDGVTLAAGSSRGTIYVFDLRSHDVPVHTISAHSSSVQSLSFQHASFGSLLKKAPPKSSNKHQSEVGLEPFNFPKNVMEGTAVNMKSETSIPLHVQRALYPHLQDLQRGSLTAEIFSPLKGASEAATEVLAKSAHSSSGNLPIPFLGSTECTPQISDAHQPEVQRDSLTNEIFSPVRDNSDYASSQVNDSSQLEVQRNSLTDDIFSPVRDLPGMPMKTPLKPQSHMVGIRRTPSAGEVFSTPSKDDIDVFSALKRQQSLGVGENILSRHVSSTKSAISDLLKTELNQFDQLPSSNKTPNEMGLFAQFETDFFRTVDETNNPLMAVTGNDEDRQFPNSERNDLEACKPFETTSEDPETMEFDITSNVSSRNLASEKLQNSPPKDCAAEAIVDEGKGSSEPATPMAPQAFQAEFIRQIVDDAMEECRQEIRRSFLHYYVQMVRQFERQKAEMEALLQRYSINDELVSEIKRLREENNHLRATF